MSGEVQKSLGKTKLSECDPEELNFRIEHGKLFAKMPVGPKKMVLVKSKEQEDEDLFHELLLDRVFVDFFNIFLSLPVFPERLLYDFKHGHFVSDSSVIALTKNFLMINHQDILKWVVRNRFPLFFESEMYFEYALCQSLVHSEELLQDTNFRRRDGCSIKKDVIKQHIGHALGMHLFKQNMSNCQGILMLHIWKELERFRCIPECFFSARCRKLREIQEQYFRNTFGDLPEDLASRLDNLLKDGFSIVSESNLLDASALNPSCELAYCIFNPHQTTGKSKLKELVHIQNLCLDLLCQYWLPRYIESQDLCCKKAGIEKCAVDSAWKIYFTPYERLQTLYEEWKLDQQYAACHLLHFKFPVKHLKERCKKSKALLLRQQSMKVLYSDCPLEAVMNSFYYKRILNNHQMSATPIQTTKPLRTTTGKPISSEKGYSCLFSSDATDEDIRLLQPYSKTTGKTQHLQCLCLGLNFIPEPKVCCNTINNLVVEEHDLLDRCVMKTIECCAGNLDKCHLCIEDYADVINNQNEYFEELQETLVDSSCNFYNISSDRMAGYPFLKHMARKQSSGHFYDASFHYDVLDYLSVRNYPLADSTKLLLKLRKSWVVLTRYEMCNPNSRPLLQSLPYHDTKPLRAAFLKCNDSAILARGKKLCKALQPDFDKYIEVEKSRFEDMVKKSALVTRSECSLEASSPPCVRSSNSAPNFWFKRQPLYNTANLKNKPQLKWHNLHSRCNPFSRSFPRLKRVRSLVDYGFERWPIVNKSFKKEEFLECMKNREQTTKLLSWSMCGLPEFVKLDNEENQEIMSLKRLTHTKNRFGSLHFPPKRKPKPRKVQPQPIPSVCKMTKSRYLDPPEISEEEKPEETSPADAFRNFLDNYLEMEKLPVEGLDASDIFTYPRRGGIEDGGQFSWLMELLFLEEERNRKADAAIEKTVNIYSNPYGDDDAMLAITHSERDVIEMEPYKKPFLYNGKLVQRENDPPENFYSMLRSPVQLRYFRRYLQFANEQPCLHYLYAIDDIRYTQDPLRKLHKLEHMYEEFFSEGTEKAALKIKVDPELVSRITEGQDVVFLDFVEVYNAVQHRLQTVVFPKYRSTFPNFYKNREEKPGRQLFLDQFTSGETKQEDDDLTISSVSQSRRRGLMPDDGDIAQVNTLLTQKNKRRSSVTSKRRSSVGSSRRSSDASKRRSSVNLLPDVEDEFTDEEVPEKDEEAYLASYLARRPRRQSSDPKAFVVPSTATSDSISMLPLADPNQDKDELLDDLFSQAMKTATTFIKMKTPKIAVRDFFKEQEGVRTEVTFNQTTLRGFSFKSTALEVMKNKRKSEVAVPVESKPLMRKKTENDVQFLWKQFIMDMVLFNRGMTCQPVREEFIKYLRFEAKRVASKMAGHQWGKPLLKRIKGRVVDMMKLPRDAYFIAECSIYINLWDIRDKFANEGLSVLEETTWLHKKASIIVELFLLSDISPMLQINIEQKRASKVVFNHISAEFGDRRSLFYTSVMTVLPTITYMWNRFVNHRYGQGFSNYQKNLRAELEALHQPIKNEPLLITRDSIKMERLRAGTPPFLRFQNRELISFENWKDVKQRLSIQSLRRSFQLLNFRKHGNYSKHKKTPMTHVPTDAGEEVPKTEQEQMNAYNLDPNTLVIDLFSERKGHVALHPNTFKANLLFGLAKATKKKNEIAFDSSYINSMYKLIASKKELHFSEGVELVRKKKGLKQRKIKQRIKRHSVAARKFDLMAAKTNTFLKTWAVPVDLKLQQLAWKLDYSLIPDEVEEEEKEETEEKENEMFIKTGQSASKIFPVAPRVFKGHRKKKNLAVDEASHKKKLNKIVPLSQVPSMYLTQSVSSITESADGPLPTMVTPDDDKFDFTTGQIEKKGPLSRVQFHKEPEEEAEEKSDFDSLSSTVPDDDSLEDARVESAQDIEDEMYVDTIRYSNRKDAPSSADKMRAKPKRKDAGSSGRKVEAPSVKPNMKKTRLSGMFPILSLSGQRTIRLSDNEIKSRVLYRKKAKERHIKNTAARKLKSCSASRSRSPDSRKSNGKLPWKPSSSVASTRSSPTFNRSKTHLKNSPFGSKSKTKAAGKAKHKNASKLPNIVVGKNTPDISAFKNKANNANTFIRKTLPTRKPLPAIPSKYAKQRSNNQFKSDGNTLGKSANNNQECPKALPVKAPLPNIPLADLPQQLHGQKTRNEVRQGFQTYRFSLLQQSAKE